MKKGLSFAAASSAAAFILSGVLGAVSVQAQVDVVESTPRMPSSVTPVPATPTPQAAVAGAQNPQAEMFFRLQQLQVEVQELRGLVEEQAYELKRLKQQRLDDYVDLDRRISALSKGGVAPTPDQSEAKTDTPAKTGSATGGELQSYRAAFQSLKQKDYEGAKTQFNTYLTDFPQGRYAPNCQYWLAEIYLLEGDLEQARQWFTRLLDVTPEHDKAADAKFKLGTVYHKLGDTEKAKALLTEVAGSNANAARLAKDYLARNLP